MLGLQCQLRLSVSHHPVQTDPANTDLASGAAIQLYRAAQGTWPSSWIVRVRESAESSHGMDKVSNLDAMKDSGWCLTPCSRLWLRPRAVRHYSMVALRMSFHLSGLGGIVWK